MQNRTPVICDSCRREGLAGLANFKSLKPLLDFKPVPRKCQRHDGWTPKRQQAFIAALAESGSVELACKAINMASVGAYTLRRQPGAEEFREAWDAALDHGADIIDAGAMERATRGVPVPIFHKGEQVGERRVFNERLTMWMLQHRKPGKYGHAQAGQHSAAELDELEARREEARENHQAWLAEIARKWRGRIRQEREARIAGNIAQADFYLRQLTHMEVILELGGGGKHLLWMVNNGRSPTDGWIRDDEATRARLYAPGSAVVQTDISARLDSERRAIWDSMGDPMRPPLPWNWGPTPNHIQGGPDVKAREHKLTAARRKAAEAERLWQEAAQEEWEARTGKKWTELPDLWAAEEENPSPPEGEGDSRPSGPWAG